MHKLLFIVGQPATVGWIFSCICAALYIFIFGIGYTGMGSIDFIQYWTAHSLALSGSNPYEPSAMLNAQQNLGRSNSAPIMMWNPPWLLVILHPILCLPFVESSRLFAILNIGLAMGAGVCIWQLYSQKGLWIAIPATLCFVPILNTTQCGQVSIVITAAAAASMLLLKRGFDRTSGMALSIVTIKPYLLYLLFVVIFWWSLRTRRYRPIFWLILSTVFLIGLTMLIDPELLRHWSDSLRSAQHVKGVVNIYEWKGAIAATAVRSWFPDARGFFPIWPIVAIPGISIIIVSGWAVFRSKRQIPLFEILPILIALSVFTSPYGWFFDHSVMLFTHIATICLTIELLPTSKLFGLLLLFVSFALQVTSLHLLLNVYEYQHQFLWLPIPLCALWLAAKLAQRAGPSEAPEVPSAIRGTVKLGSR